MEICPNRNSPEWKQLVEQVGEHMAEITFFKLGEMPDVKGLTELKQAVKWSSRTENYKAIAGNIAKYNSKNGTSHRFRKQNIYGNTWELIFVPSYLPVTLEAQRLKAARKNDNFVVENLDESSFKEIEPRWTVEEPFRHTAREGEQGKFNEEGDFIPLDDTDELIDIASDKITSIEKKRKQRIEKEIIKARQELLGETDITSIREKTFKLEKLKVLLDKAEGLVQESKGIEAFEDVLSFADRQLGEVDKMLNSENLTAQDVNYIRKVVNAWKKAGDFSVNEEAHMFLDKNEFNTPEIREAFKYRQGLAEDFDRKLTTIEEDMTVAWIQSTSNREISRDEIFKVLSDTGKINSMVSALHRHDDAMLQTIANVIERANMTAKVEVQDIWKELDSLGSKVLKKQKNFSIFQQLDEEGKKTGRMVHRFSPSFWLKRADLINKAFEQREEGVKVHRKNDIEAYWKWVNENTINFDVRLLFPDSHSEDGDTPSQFLYSKEYTQEQKDAHIADLKSHLGEKGYQFYLNQAEKKVKSFQLLRDVTYSSLMVDEKYSPEQREDLFEVWVKEHSPYWGAEMSENPEARKTADGKQFYSAKGTREYGIQIPRNKVGSKETSWYDKNFSKIEGDEDLLAFHKLITTTLNDLNKVLPQDKKKLMQLGVIPSMKKSMMDIFNEKGLMMGITPFFDAIKELQTTTDFSSVAKGDVDPITGEIEQNLNISFIEDNSSKVNDLVKFKKIQYEQTTGKIATSVELKKFKAEALDEVANEQSWDLIKVMKAYSMTVLAYKHKTFVEPQIKIAEKLFNDRLEKSLNDAGEQLYDKNQKPLTQKGLINYKSTLEYYLKSEFYNTGGRKVEGVSKTKLYTKSESNKKKELEALMEKASDEEKVTLQEQIDALGGQATMSGRVDAALKWNTMLNLGWNIGSAFSNLGFGAISNIIQASDGRDYTSKDLRKAYMLTTNSVGRNLSFNNWQGVNGNALKIRTLMDKFDLLKTSNNEMFDTSIKSSFVKLKRFGPMTLQERTEYLNIAPLMIAVMMKHKATSPDGSDTTLWEAYDVETGKLKKGYSSNVDEIKLIQQIKRISEMNHGDYNTALQAKETVVGRIFAQHRTWMFEGFKNRFEMEKADDSLSYGVEGTYIRKGRYRSYTKGQLTTTGAAVGTMFLPGIGTAIGGAAGYVIGKFTSGPEIDGTVFNDVLYTLKQLGRKLIFSSARHESFNDKFSEVDAANMRKNMTELYVLVSLMGIGLILKYLAGDDDEEKKKIDNWQLNFLINQTNRLTTDIEFYTNPISLQELTQSAVPLTGLVEKVGKFTKDVYTLFDEDSENDDFQSGAFKGKNKAVIHGLELFPLSSAGVKVIRQGATVFNK